MSTIWEDLKNDWGKEDVFGPWTQLGQQDSSSFKFYKTYYLISYNNGKTNIDAMENEKVNQEMEHCINCDKVTEYPKNLNIDYREHYVEGAGQLCKECYNKIYSK